MMHTGTPLSTRVYGATAICLQLTLLVGCISIPTSSSPLSPAPGSDRDLSAVAVVSAHTPALPTPATGAEDFPHESTLEEQLGWTFRQSRYLVEQATNTDLRHVTIRIASESEIQNEVTRVTERLVSKQFNNKRYARAFLKKIVADQQGTYAALYVDNIQQVMVSRSLLRAYVDSIGNRSTRHQALQALLIHELVHAADDVIYGIHENRVLSFKASFTQSAAFEGHAQFVTRQICTRNDCLAGMDALETFMFETTQISDPVAQSVQAISRNVLEYSYIEGERFLTELSRRPNGQALIEQVLQQPPDDPVQILVAETYPDTAREARNRNLLKVLQPAGHIWSRAPWTLVETSPIKGIDVRNDPTRRVAAVEGFTELIVSMTGAQLYNQSSLDIAPVDIMLIEAENPSTARLFAESFVNRSANTMASEQGHTAVEVDRFENQGVFNYSLFQVATKGQQWPGEQTATVIGLLGPYVAQISTSIVAQDTTLQHYARKVISALARQSDID